MQVADQLNAWATLADQKVPLEDRDKLRLMVHNRVYQKMLGDSSWVQESLVSAAIAFEARQQADVGHAFNFQVVWDQQMPTALGNRSSMARSPRPPARPRLPGSTPSSRSSSRPVRAISSLRQRLRPTRSIKVTAIASDTSLTLGSSTNIVTGTTSARSHHEPTRHRDHRHDRRGHRQLHQLPPRQVGQWISGRGRPQRDHGHPVSGLPDHGLQLGHVRDGRADPASATSTGGIVTMQSYT